MRDETFVEIVDLGALSVGEVVYLTTQDYHRIVGGKPLFRGFNRAPAIVLAPDSAKNGLELLVLDGHGFSRVRRDSREPAPAIAAIQRFSFGLRLSAVDVTDNCATAMDNLVLERKASLFVPTPDGTLHAFASRDAAYPGIWVRLLRDGMQPVPLALTEYVPGDENVAAEDPKRPEETTRQAAEVPPQRRVPSPDGDPLHDGVTPGLVTRAWPVEDPIENAHIRVFHYGYNCKEPDHKED